MAAHEGREDVVGVLLSYKADVDRRNRSGETALHLACRQGRTRVVRLLLEKCADPRQAYIIFSFLVLGYLVEQGVG